MDIRKEYLAPGIVAYYDVMENPQDFISDLEGLVEINNLQWLPGTTGDANNATSNNEVSNSIRDVETIGLASFDRNPSLRNTVNGPRLQLHEYLNDTVYPVARDYAIEHGILGYATGENWQILKYGKGHHFANHVDDSKAYPRTFSISYYLNDGYEGGEIEFPRFDLKIKPVANQAIVFAANYVYNHKIYPVTEGTRYTVVNWFE
jgi:Rps23 Pro-64 3,4-dihydroxylase Tpa1-like proline 4-hydroxylase